MDQRGGAGTGGGKGQVWQAGLCQIVRDLVAGVRGIGGGGVSGEDVGWGKHNQAQQAALGEDTVGKTPCRLDSVTL